MLEAKKIEEKLREIFLGVSLVPAFVRADDILL